MPLAMALRRARPDVSLTWITQPESAPLLVDHPAVSRVATFPRRGTRGEQLRALRDLRRLRVDLLLDPQGNLKSGLVSAAVRARRRVGVRVRDATEWPNRLTHGECVEPYDRNEHVVDRYLSFARHLRVRDRRIEYGLSPATSALAAVRRRIESLGDAPLLILQVGDFRDPRQWRAERMAAVADALSELDGHAAIVTTGPKHVADGREVARRSRGLACSTSPVFSTSAS
jgi:ADP-heptose:LPS heptosyltransferase